MGVNPSDGVFNCNDKCRAFTLYLLRYWPYPLQTRGEGGWGQIVRGMRDSFKRTLTASRAISRMNGVNKSVYLYSLRSLVGSLDQVMLLGDSGVGKTCLLVRFRDGTFLSGNFISTVGIDFRVRAFAQLTINVVLSFYCVL